MKSPDMRDVGAGGADPSIMREIGFGRVAAVHRLEDAVAARLHRQVQIGHQLVDLAMRGDQARRSCRRGGWSCSGCARAHRSWRARGSGRRGRARRRVQAFTFWPSSVISRAPRIDQRLRLVDDVAPRPRDLGAAGVGHDAIGAEFVAAFLHGQEGARGRAAARREARRTW